MGAATSGDEEKERALNEEIGRALRKHLRASANELPGSIQTLIARLRD